MKNESLLIISTNTLGGSKNDNLWLYLLKQKESDEAFFHERIYDKNDIPVGYTVKEEEG